MKNKFMYVCGVAYQHEIDEIHVELYDSLEEAKEALPCWQQCGIVEMEINDNGYEIGHQWVEKQDFSIVGKPVHV